MNTSESVSGVLFSCGIATTCRVGLAAETGISTPTAVYPECMVLETADNLPDGIYELWFRDQVAFVRLQNGIWSPGVPWSTDRIAVRRSISTEYAMIAELKSAPEATSTGYIRLFFTELLKRRSREIWTRRSARVA